MAIRVICPGCMTRFEVGDKFAGKTGPCPKCAHLIQIPKENLVVHAPDEIPSSGKPGKPGRPRITAHPMVRLRFIVTLPRVMLSLMGVIAVLIACWGVSYLPTSLPKSLLTGICLLGVTFPMVCFGYMMIRDDEDLEIFLGNELYRRSFWVSLGFFVTWLVMEFFMALMTPGPWFFIYLAPLAVLGAFVAVIVFNTDFNRGISLFLLIALCIIILRGIVFAPQGWVWSQQMLHVRASSPPPVETVSEGIRTGNNTRVSPKKPITRDAPDARSGLKR